MNSLSDVIREHASRYPLMQPCDAVKLVYQSEFGGGHLISHPSDSMERLEREYQAVLQTHTASPSPYIESIGGGISRVHLGGWQHSLSLLNRLFVCSASQTQGSGDRFAQKLQLLASLAEEGIFCFSPKELEEYLAQYRAAGCPAVSHSPIYRAAYHPAYRIVEERYLPLLPALAQMERLLRQKNAINVAIDGCAAAGKTTAAQLISQLFHCTIVHMDDFFLPPSLRTPARLEEPGGNIHYERFEQQVVPGLISRQAFSYPPYCCATGAYLPQRDCPAAEITLVEGCYSLHPRWSEVFDYKLFLEIDPELQTQRILARNGKDMLQRFVELWIPLENQYFSAFHIPQSCDIVLNLPGTIPLGMSSLHEK